MKLVLGQTVVDLDTCEAIRGDECTPLTQAEVALLRHLAEAAPATVTRQVLQVEALGYSERARTRAVDHAMARLRKKIEQDPTNPQFLVSVRGIGYRLQQPEPVVGIEAPNLVGRDRELAELNALPAGVHVLHGPGGMGKSSLGRALCGAHPGSHFVALAEATDLPAAVDALGQALGVPLRGGLDTQVNQVRVRLEQQPVPWLVLDNAEQLPDDALTQLVAAAQQPGQRTLVTSRRRVDALACAHVALGPLEPDAASELYETRAAERVAGWSLDPSDEPTLRQFLASVDHMPLAIELAASRVQLLGPHELLRRESRLLKLKGTASSHASTSLDACIEMSWELLEPTAREAWAACTIFEGGFDLQAFEAVTAVEDGLEALQVLVDHGLLMVDPDAPGARRFMWMVALRAFARARLVDMGIEEACRDRHLAHFAERVRPLNRQVERTGDLRWALRERGNLRAAARWGLTRNHEQGCSVLRMLEVIFQDRGPGSERLELFELAQTTMPPGTALGLRCWLDSRTALALLGVGRRDEALELSNEVVDMVDQLADPEDKALVWMAHGALNLHLGDMDQAAEAMNQCSIHAKRAGNRFLMGLGMYNLAYAHYVRNNGDAALDCALQALADLEMARAPRMVTAALTLVATVQMQRGELQDARATLERSVEDAVHGGLIWVDNRATLARLLLELEQPAEAIEEAMPMVQQAVALDLPAMHGDLLDLLARARQALGQNAEARASAHEALKLHLQLGRDDAAQATRELLDKLKT